MIVLEVIMKQQQQLIVPVQAKGAVQCSSVVQLILPPPSVCKSDDRPDADDHGIHTDRVPVCPA